MHYWNGLALLGITIMMTKEEVDTVNGVITLLMVHGLALLGITIMMPKEEVD